MNYVGMFYINFCMQNIENYFNKIHPNILYILLLTNNFYNLHHN